MRLRDLLENQAVMQREALIGREIDVQGKKALILGLREVEEMEDGELTLCAKLAMLHEESLDDELWDEEDEDWEEEEELTNRQSLIETLDTEGDIAGTDLEALIVNGIRYGIDEINVSYLEEQPYEEMILIKDFAEKGCIPDSWLEQETDMLTFAEYTVDSAMFEVTWDADILNIESEMIEPVEEVLVGKVLKCSVGRYEQPEEFIIKGRDGDDIVVRLHGVYLHDIWTDPSCLEMDFADLEDYCERDKRLLVVEYSTDPQLQMEFYTKEFLDAQADDEDHVSEMCLFSEDESRELCVIDVVPEDFDGEVEIELLSYIM